MATTKKMASEAKAGGTVLAPIAAGNAASTQKVAAKSSAKAPIKAAVTAAVKAAVKVAAKAPAKAPEPKKDVAEKSLSRPAAKKIAKQKKPKLVRDSFTIPKAEYGVLEELKQRAAQLARPVKKSELLRASIKVLASLSGAAFLTALNQVPTIKTGRPSLKK